MDARYKETMLNVKGRKIFCKIRFNPQSPANFLLLLPDLPGYDHQALLPLAERLVAAAEKNHAIIPSIVLFDFPGCGRSDKANDPTQEYTVDNFAEVTAFIIEHIKLGASPPGHIITFQLYCESFGSLVAMSMIQRRPKWTRHGSDIRLTQIISNGGICGMRDEQYAMNYIFERYFHHEAYESIQHALTKLFAGNILDFEDYIRNIAIPLSPLFSQAYAGLPNSTIGMILRERPKLGSMILHVLKFIGYQLGRDVRPIEDNIHHFTGVSIEVMKRFFATRFNRTDVLKMVTDNPTIYSGLNIVMLAGNEDCFINYEHVLAIKQKLRGTSGVIILNDRHLALSAANLEALKTIVLKTAIQRLFPHDLKSAFISYYDFPKDIPTSNPVGRAKIFKCSTRKINAATGEVTEQVDTEVTINKRGQRSVSHDTNIRKNTPKQTLPTIIMSSGSYQPISDHPEEMVVIRKK